MLCPVPGVRYEGRVDSVGFGVTPDTDLIGRLTTPGLPDVQRTLNWVHLASRFPVRIRILNGPPDAFRLGESATVIIRGYALRTDRGRQDMASEPIHLPHPERFSDWFPDFLKKELAPYPGRGALVARIVISATLTMIIIVTFRIPGGVMWAP